MWSPEPWHDLRAGTQARPYSSKIKMIQDIFPHKLNTEYKPCGPSPDSPVIILKNDAVLIGQKDGGVSFPLFADTGIQKDEAIYLFTVDGESFYTVTGDIPGTVPDLQENGFEFAGIQAFRTLAPRHLAFAGALGTRLAIWYSSNRFCGACGKKLALSETERALVCPDCGKTVYPRIDPAVIVGITNGDKILLTKYRGRANNPRYALVAGYCETGETAEDTVRREVFEEVGLRVKNIRYYKSQPWLFSGSMLFGFFCEVDGDDTVRIERSELDTAEWAAREDIIQADDNVSLTSEMIAVFAEQR